MDERFEAKTVKFLNSRTSSTWSDCATLPLETADCRERERRGQLRSKMVSNVTQQQHLGCAACATGVQQCSCSTWKNWTNGQPTKETHPAKRSHMVLFVGGKASPKSNQHQHPHFVHGQAGPAMARPGRGSCPASQAYPGMETTRTVTLLMHDGVLT